MPEGEPNGLAGVEPPVAPGGFGLNGPRGTVHAQATGFEHFLGAEDVIAVADENARRQAHTGHDLGHGDGGMDGGLALSFQDDGLARHAAADEVVAADGAFGEDGVAAGAAGGDDARREFALKERERVVEAGLEDGRWFSAVFGSAHDDDDVGGLGFVDSGLGVNAEGQPGEPQQEAKAGCEGDPAKKSATVLAPRYA